jgi:hypothetical protein
MVKFVTQKVTVGKPNDVVSFSLKLGKESALFAGYIATVTTDAALDAEKTLCNVGLQFALNKFPVSIPCDNKPINQIKQFKIFDILHEIAKNTNIDGFVNDLGSAAVYPYNVSVSCKIIEHEQ